MSTGLWFFRPPYIAPKPSQKLTAVTTAGIVLVDTTGAASGVGAATATGIGAAIAQGTASGIGTAAAAALSPFAEMQGLAVGIGTASAVSNALYPSPTTGVAVGVGTASASGVAFAPVGTAFGRGRATARSVTDINDSADVFRLCHMSNLQFNPVSNTIVIKPEIGEPITRKTYTGDMEDITGTFRMISRSQALAIEEFFRVTLKDGSLQFFAEHPMTGEEENVFMFLKEPALTRNGHLYDVTLSVRKMDIG